MSEKKKYNIRLKLLIPFVISLFVVVIGSQTIVYFYQKNETEEFVHNVDIELQKSIQQAIVQESEKLLGFLHLIKDLPESYQAWWRKDRQSLYEKSHNLYEQLNKAHLITHFYYHNSDGVNFLRVHLPGKYGDVINRVTLKKAMSTHKSAYGIEFGALGQLVLRVVIPWKRNGEVIGYIELGEEIDQIIERLSETYDYQMILTVSKDFINQYNLTETKNILNMHEAGKVLGEVYIVNQTMDVIPEKILKYTNDKNLKKSTVINWNDQNYLTSNIMIKGASGKGVSKLTYFVNFDSHIKHNKQLLWNILVLNILIGFFVLLFYYSYSGHLEKKLQISYEILKHENHERKLIEEELIVNKTQLEDLVRERDSSLIESKKRYQTLFDETADALLLIEGDKFIDCNQASLDMFGYKNKEELFKTHPSFISPELQPDGQTSKNKADEMMKLAFEKNSHRFEWLHKRKNGETFPVEVLLTAVPFEGVRLLHAVCRDISERKEAEDEIRFRAYYDSLTKLPNRQLLLDRLKQLYISSQRQQSLNALIFLDVDRFKTINDSLGHSIGDDLLVETAERIQSCIRADDTLARFGGDEFVILLKELGHEQEQEQVTLNAKQVAQKIQDRFALSFKLQGHELYVTLSIGITIFPLEEDSIEDIIKHADTAMYSAKDAGRNQISFYLSDMHETVLKRLTLEKDLRQAVKNNQLEVYYQPQFNNGKEVIGVEALIRWQHPELGFVNPEEFIAVAEDTGIIFDIGKFVLTQSIDDVLSLQKESKQSIHLSVNISPQQFRSPDFVYQIKNITQEFNLERQFLTLEVTEGIIIDNLSEVVDKLEQLRHLGIRMSLDDFGTGYSSLSYLKRLPLDELKIDKSFVFDVLKDPHDALLVQTIINISNQFVLDTVAEGVETRDQLDFLQRSGCKYYQGYYYSRPLPLHELKTFLLETDMS